MKKLFLIMACLCGVIAITSVFGEEKKETRREITAVEDVMCPETTRDDDQLRSFTPIVEVWCDYNIQYIEVIFNYRVGSETITLTNDLGQVVAAVTVNTQTTPSVLIPMPAQGAYQMLISGEKYIGKSDFVIE